MFDTLESAIKGRKLRRKLAAGSAFASPAHGSAKDINGSKEAGEAVAAAELLPPPDGAGGDLKAAGPSVPANGTARARRIACATVVLRAHRMASGERRPGGDGPSIINSAPVPDLIPAGAQVGVLFRSRHAAPLGIPHDLLLATGRR